MAEGLRLLDEGADQMTPVDLPDSLVAGAPMAARNGKNRRRAEMGSDREG